MSEAERRCIVCGGGMFGVHWNADTCSSECRVAARRARQRAYRAANLEKCRAWERKYRRNNPQKALEWERGDRAANPEKYRQKARQKRATNLDHVREYDRQWKRARRAANPEAARETVRKALIVRRAALLAVKDILGLPEAKRIGARRRGPIKPLDRELLQYRMRERLCICCGADIKTRPPRTKVCASAECHRERARLRAAEYRWKNIDLVREKERIKAAADPSNKPRAKLWHEKHRERAIARSRTRYASSRATILERQHDAYVQEMAALSVIRELQPGERNEA